MSDCVCVKSKTVVGPVVAQISAILVGRRAAFWFGVVALALLLAAFERSGGRVLAAETKSVWKVDPVALLQGVREAQASIKQTLQGKLRKGSRSMLYRMVMDGPRVRFEFPEAVPPAPLLVNLYFGEKSASIEVGTAAGTSQKVNFADEIPGMGVCYEDLALRFLYWSDATLEGEESLMLAKCWKIRVRRPAGVRSPYREVLVWVSQTDAAFLKSESYGDDGALLRRLTVRQIQSLDQVTTLKQLRIESPGRDATPTYLDVDGQPSTRPAK
ncbi:MAG: outer membrane lipoprotein-sorting protein [Verrucomicrobia bacterium]|nr:MAG: outer membrane lipoprotein-sorting protein [Verrucomicrobiota bacterium]